MPRSAQLIRTNVLGLTFRSCSLLVGLGIAALLARLLGLSGYGIYAAALALVSLINVPLQLGLPTLVLRQVTMYREREQWNLLRGILLWAHRLILYASFGIGLLALAAYVLRTKLWFSWTPATAWALALAPLMACNRVREAALQGLRRIAWAQVPDQLVTPLAYLACLAVFSVTATGLVQPQTAMAIYVGCALAGFLIGSILLGSFIPAQVRRAAVRFESGTWLRGILPLSLISGFGIVNGQIDILLLNLLSTPENVGLYRVAFTSAAMTSLVGATIGNLMSSQYAEFYLRADYARLQTLVRYSAWAAFLPAVCVLMAFLLAGGPILTAAFGRDFAAAKTAVVVLCVGQTINCAAGVVQTLLNMTGHSQDTLKGVSAGAITNVALNLLLVPHLGAVGAAAATSTGIIVENTTCSILAWQRVRINTTILPPYRSAAHA
jgi:O-antigen/teichoic acid export membrane protein